MKKRFLFILAGLMLAANGCNNGDVSPFDACPDDENKTMPGICGCGVEDVDANENGIVDCLEKKIDLCPEDDAKTMPGVCGCGKPDVDANENGIMDCLEGTVDLCPDNPNKTAPGVCGCKLNDVDEDNNGVIDCLESGEDLCPDDPDKDLPGVCDCGTPDTDSDNNGIPDCLDGKVDLCPNDANKTAPGVCGCGTPDTDINNNGIPDCLDDNIDLCPDDDTKTMPGICGCGTPDTDSDGDTVPDCFDVCKEDPNKTDEGLCGCGKADEIIDTDMDGVIDCLDGCPENPFKTEPGILGCDVDDDDNDGVKNDDDPCPYNPNVKSIPAGDPDEFWNLNPYYCNLSGNDENKVFQIWGAQDFNTLDKYMKEIADANGNLDTVCAKEDQINDACNGDINSLCKNVMPFEGLSFTLNQKDELCTCKDGKIACDQPESAGIEITDACTPVPEGGTADLTKQGTCCTNHGSHGKVGELIAQCIGDYNIAMVKSGGKIGDYCVPDEYTSPEVAEGKTLVCVLKDIVIKRGDKTYTGVTGVLNDLYLSGGKEGDLCDISHPESCLDDGSALRCIDGVLTKIACANQCEKFDKDANHVACIPAMASNADKVKVQLMRDINFAESVPVTTKTNTIGCTAQTDKWPQAMLYNADFDGQNHTISFVSNGQSCAAPDALFSQVVHSSVHDLNAHYDLDGSSSAVVAKAFIDSTASKITIHSDIITNAENTYLNYNNGSEINVSPSFGSVAGISYRSAFSDIDVKGNAYLDSTYTGLITGVTNQTIVRDSKIDIDALAGYTSIVMDGVGRNVISNVKANIQKKAALVSTKYNYSQNAVFGVSYLSADVYDVDVTIGSVGEKASLFAYMDGSREPAEVFRFHFDVKDASASESFIGFAEESISNLSLHDSTFHVGKVHPDTMFMLFQDLNHSDIDTFSVQLDTLPNSTKNALVDNLLDSQLKNIKVEVANIDNAFKGVFVPFNQMENVTVDTMSVSYPDFELNVETESSVLAGLTESAHKSDISNIDIQFGKSFGIVTLAGVLGSMSESSIKKAKIQFKDVSASYFLPLAYGIADKSIIEDVTVTTNDITKTGAFLAMPSHVEDSEMTKYHVTTGNIDGCDNINYEESIDISEPTIVNSRFSDIALSYGDIRSKGIVGLGGYAEKSTFDHIDIRAKNTIADDSLAALLAYAVDTEFTNTSIQMGRVKTAAYTDIFLQGGDFTLKNYAQYADVHITSKILNDKGESVENDQMEITSGLITGYMGKAIHIENAVFLTRFGLYNDDDKLEKWLNETPLIGSFDEETDIKMNNVFILERKDMCPEETSCSAGKLNDHVKWFTPDKTPEIVNELANGLAETDRSWTEMDFTEQTDGQDAKISLPWFKD